MNRLPLLLPLVLGLILTGLDFTPRPASAAALAAELRARLPEQVVLATPLEAAGREVRFGILPGSSCRLAITILAREFAVSIDGRPVRPTAAARACRAARVHRVAVRA